jgi:hypothetical protein
MRPLRTQLRRAPHFPCGGVGSTPAVRSNNIGPGSCGASAFLGAYRSQMCRSADVLSPHDAAGYPRNPPWSSGVESSNPAEEKDGDVCDQPA